MPQFLCAEWPFLCKRTWAVKCKYFTNKLATQFHPNGRNKATGVLFANAGALCFHRHSGTVMWGSYLKNDVKRGTWIQLGVAFWSWGLSWCTVLAPTMARVWFWKAVEPVSHK